MSIEQKLGKQNETFTIPEEVVTETGTTTVYKNYTKDEYIEWLRNANQNLYDTGIKLRDNLIACQSE